MHELANCLHQFLILIISDFIQNLGKYEPIVQKLEAAYQQVITSLPDKSVIPYYPNLYPVPFMIIKRYRVRLYLTQVLFYSLAYPDVDDFHKFAIYIYEGLIENFPSLLPGVIGHEIAHVIASKGRVELTKEDLALILKDRLGYINAKEKKALKMCIVALQKKYSLR
jgi:Zn-dependent protease with chaperone function